MSVDTRTRTDGSNDLADLDAAALFGQVLPEAFAARRDLLAPAATWLAPPPLTVAVTKGGSTRPDGTEDSWTLRARNGSVTVTRGPDPDGDRLRVDPDQLTLLVADQVTPMGWFSSRALRLEGRLTRLLDWWLLIRGALDGVAPTLPGDIGFSDPDGRPLGIDRSFSLDDDPGEMAHFVSQTGFLRIRGVFSAGEMAAVSADMDAARPDFHPGDGRSWWATTSEGTQRLVRMQRFDELSSVVASFIGDNRVTAIAGLTGDGHRWPDPGGNRIEALFKPVGVVQGISDVPWHKDCSLGRHSYECCSLTIGISVTGAGARTGQLQVVAGSNRAQIWPALLQPGLGLPVVALPTSAGDVTVHLSCTLHMAVPPVDTERRVLYGGLSLPPLAADAAAKARARLQEVREAAPVSVSQPPSPAPADRAS